MDRSAVQDWLDRYVAAWKSYDSDAIGSLFAEDATYRYHPYDREFVQGREAIVTDWLDARDDEGTYDARYEAYAVDGDRAVAVGTSTYFSDATQSTIERVFHNVYLLRFDAAGRCVEFTEFFMQAPGES